MALRLPARLADRSGGGLDVLQYEVFQEMAGTLARLGRALEESLHELAAFDQARETAPDASDEAEAERRRELVAAAGEALWYYVVQREVCGLRDTETVMRQLGVPLEVRLRMGPRRPRGR